ncbi:MAG: Wzz/FepE/Etk N-terminal domain-containing protein [Candidatus Omnitrophota bacterium]|jgi:capsular polysaccharide biosynthesis protein
MENQQYISEDEIDLRQYLKIIIKRKKLILTIFLVSVFAAAIISLLIPKTYEITSIVQLGSIDGLLIKNEEAKAIMTNQNLLLSIISDLKLKASVEGLQKAIKISDISGTDLLKIKIAYSDVDAAQKIIEAITSPLFVQGQALYQERSVIINERLNELNMEIKNAEEDINRTQNLISGALGSSNVSQADISLRVILLQNTLPNYESNLTALRSQRNGLKLLLSDAKSFKVFDKPIRLENPISPKKPQIVMTTGILSLILGIFLVFSLEFFQEDRKGAVK